MHWYTFYSFKVAILAFQLYKQKRKENTTFKLETDAYMKELSLRHENSSQK